MRFFRKKKGAMRFRLRCYAIAIPAFYTVGTCRPSR